MDYIDIDFDLILNEIEDIYNENEIEYNSYIKTRQLVPYNYTNNTILIAIYCYTAILNTFFYINNI